MNYDQYEDLSKISSRIYKNVRPAVREMQMRLTPYTPKPFGEKRTYPQNWPIYTPAMGQDKLMVYRIIKDSVDYLDILYEYPGNGRPKVDYSDVIKSLCLKSYHNFSSWRLESELKIARAMGIINIVHKKSTLNKYMKDKIVTKYLRQLYQVIAEPLKDVEIYFAADGSGVSNSYGRSRWMTIRHTKKEEKQRRFYNKLHIMIGTKTGIIASARITDGRANESPHFRPLLDDTAKIFTIKEVSADAGYIGRENVEAVAEIGAMPYIMPKRGIHVPMKGPMTAWGAMLRLWKHHRMYFAEHFHRRSKVESCFSSCKRKFGDFCRCKMSETQENEILCRVVCYNASVLSKALLSFDLSSGFMATL